MEPPSYDEASLHPPAPTQAFDTILPPSYDAYFNSPSTPPPSYGEAVTNQPDPFPVLILPTVPTAATSPSQNPGITVHSFTQVGAQPSVNTAVVTQPQPVPFSVTCLTDNPGLVRCPSCHRVVTSKVTYLPGRAAWCLCMLLTMMGCFCGFCLIPLVVRSLQDTHHSCPQCGKHLYIYMR